MLATLFSAPVAPMRREPDHPRATRLPLGSTLAGAGEIQPFHSSVTAPVVFAAMPSPPVNTRRRALGLIAAAAAAPQQALAQAAPVQALRWVVPFPPGGLLDSVARIIGPRLGAALQATEPRFQGAAAFAKHLAREHGQWKDVVGYAKIVLD